MPHYKLRLGGNTMVLPEGTHDVGRSSDCWLTLEDELSSRVHARFIVQAHRAEIEDLRSRNGTFINGERIEGKRQLHDGDRVRIGRELMTIIESESDDLDDEDKMRRTLAPGEQAGLPELMSQLIDKSIKVGKTRDAERYGSALFAQLSGAKLAPDHPAAHTAVECMVRLAEHTASGVWLDRMFQLHVSNSWVLPIATLDRVRRALDRIPRIPGDSLRKYEERLREMVREGAEVSPRLVTGIGELVDSYGK